MTSKHTDQLSPNTRASLWWRVPGLGNIAGAIGMAFVGFFFFAPTARAYAVSCLEYGETENYVLEFEGISAVDGGEVPADESNLWDDDSDKSLELPESHSTYLLPRLRYEFDGGLVTRIVFDAGESP